jgi:hypothetical protein
MILMSIKLPVLVTLTDSIGKLKEVQTTQIFYNIDSIQHYGLKTLLFSGGLQFLIPIHIDELDELIKKNSLS